MRKKYHLWVIKPGSYGESVDIIADKIEIRDGSIIFYLNNEIKCVYPSSLTIITSISS